MNGDQKAWFLGQVEAEQSRLRASIRALGVRAEAVDDFAQETFLFAWNQLGQFDRTGSFGEWLRQIARRLVANERRKNVRQRVLLLGPAGEHLVRQQTESNPHAEINSAGDDVAALRKCLASLPAHSRQLLEQRYFEEKSPGVLASQLGQPSARVRQTLLRLRRLLLVCLEQSVNKATPVNPAPA